MRFVLQVYNKIGMSVVSPDTFVTMRKSALELLAFALELALLEEGLRDSTFWDTSS